MKRIYKSTILSTKYKNWVEAFTGSHDKYSASNKYYFDVRMSLFYCQNGLCAYTEEKLCDKSLIDLSKWVDGKHIGLTGNEFTFGDVEHFDESIKPTKGWLWDNLFMVQGDINKRVKHTKAINYILKPDSTDYDENKYLSYNHKTDVFYPNDSLSPTEKVDVEYMITTLGINKVVRRKDLIKELEVAIELDLLDALPNPIEYITAWNMTIDNLSN